MSEYSRYGICEECNQPGTSSSWCKECNAKRFQENFQNWTSGNDNIDKFIQHTQLSATFNNKVLEWIPYDRFKNIEYIAKGGFGIVYKAIWIDGIIDEWDNENKNWKRENENGNYLVALKSLNNSKNVGLEFINEITSHHKVSAADYYVMISFYGITQDPETKNYMMVLQYAEDGSLRNYLDKNKNKSWRNKILDLLNIASGLSTVHEKDLIHRDLHIGNILKMAGYYYNTRITDMGLSKPADYKDDNTKKSIYGVLPYVAPEILRGQNYTKASDIYSFGIIMYEVFSELPPYYDISHNENLAIKICKGLRPRFNIKVPQLIINLIKRCLDANPLNRPTAEELEEILEKWYLELRNEYEKQTVIVKQIEEADEINKNLETGKLSPSTSLETHSEAIYTSRLLDFNNLPEPKNSDDYYEQNNNIISAEFSESLQIDISQLKINNDNQNSESKDSLQIDISQLEISKDRDGGDPMSGFKPCEEGKTYPITFTKLQLDPNPIVLGKPLTTTVVGKSTVTIEEGATCKTEASLDGVSLFTKEEDACKYGECPHTPGDFNFSSTETPPASPILL